MWTAPKPSDANAPRSLKWLTADESRIRATKVIDADPVAMPNGVDYAGVVGAKIMVNTTGDVVCLWAVSGHPVLIPAAIRALHQWKFRPMTVGRPTSRIRSTSKSSSSFNCQKLTA